MRDKSKYVYRRIADHFRNLIYSGELVSGEKFVTRKQLCATYGISLVTAFNVQKVLQENGLIVNVPGIGFFVNCPEMYRINHPNAPVRKIRMIGSPQAIGDGTDFGSELVAGAREACGKHSLDFNLEMVQVLNNPAHIINTSRRLDSDEALLVFLHDELLPEIVNLLLSPDVRAVTVGRAFPDKTAVLHDYHHAVGEILAFCQRRKFCRLLYVGQCNQWLALRHESEFFRVFESLVKEFPFEYHVNLSGNFPNVAGEIRSIRPDAVIFSHDEGALRLRDHYFSADEKRPPFIGFGDYPSPEGKEKLRFTYRSDAREMGRRAVEILLRPDLCIHPPLDERIRGRLIERE